MSKSKNIIIIEKYGEGFRAYFEEYPERGEWGPLRQVAIYELLRSFEVIKEIDGFNARLELGGKPIRPPRQH